jgi:hypothetical protein
MIEIEVIKLLFLMKAFESGARLNFVPHQKKIRGTSNFVSFAQPPCNP